MTQKQTLYKKALIKDIQINKHRVFADDEERKEFMLSRFGVDSTTKLSIEELVKLRDFCLGNVSDIKVDLLSEAQGWRINALWREKARDKSTMALLLFAKRICKRNIYDILTLKKAEATKLIVALDKLQG
ncbi:MAG: hypothetical protein PHE67_10130 [Campylobacterales bacterium]|nr:hypothetical protein [Campylobacterales bacterium]